MSAERPGLDARRIETVLRYLDGGLAPAEVAALAEELRTDPDCRRGVAELLVQLEALEETADKRPAEEATAAAGSEPRRSRRRWLGAGLAVAGAAVVAFVAWRWGREPTLAGGPDTRAPLGRRAPAGSPVGGALPGSDSLPVVLLVHGSDPVHGRELDALVIHRLERLGFAVSSVTERALAEPDLAGKALVLISSSADGASLRDRLPRVGLREAALPVMSCELEALGPLGMTRAQGVARAQTGVLVQRPEHPLAAAESGLVQIASTPVTLTWGRLGPGAVTVATLEDGQRPVVFGYEAGAVMVGGLLAPARRVSCFLVPVEAAAVTEPGWQLFEAAVRWVTDSL